jgi:hypothetical protein
VQIATLQPSQVAHPSIERADAQLCIRITGGEAHKHANAPDPFSPLRLRRERPCCRRAPERGYQFAPFDRDWRVTLPCEGCLGNISRHKCAVSPLRLTAWPSTRNY